MKYPPIVLAAACAAALAGSNALAQTQPSPEEGGAIAPAVVTDAGPAPAQERDSMGAIVLENSMVLAQRRVAFEQASARTGVASVGRAVLRATRRAQARAELAQAREDAEVQFYQHGAGALTPQ
jgi:hypothetical protein